MIRTVYFGCRLSRSMADALNLESGRIYSQVLVEQYRIYRKKGIWLSPKAQEHYTDYLNRDRPPLLHAHSIDSAQQGFPKACKTAKANRDAGAHYPHKRKRYRTTVWKNTAIRLKDGCLLLSLARGNEPLCVELPEPLQALPAKAFTEMRLVYNKAAHHYEWHLVVDDGVIPKPVETGGVTAGDMGELHPIALTDGEEAVVMACRQLRAQNQHTNKQLASLQAQQATKVKGSKRWWRLERRKRRFLEKQARRKRDIEHKISRAAVDWCVERKVGNLVLGDVRDVADGKRMNTKSQQKISNWSHGKLRRYIGYKAAAAGIRVFDKVDEAYTSQTCVTCGNRHKPKGRLYRCPTCGAVVHRDVQGAANILSRFLYGELAKVPVPKDIKYRRPAAYGKRSMRSSVGHTGNSS